MARAAAYRIELVALPTYASYLNPDESHFLPITEFVVNNADYLDWDAFAHAIPPTSPIPTAPTATVDSPPASASSWSPPER